MKKNVEKVYDIDLIINSLGRGGAERVCVTLANELQNKNYSVRIITLRNVEKNYISDVNENVCIECLNAKKDILGLFELASVLKTKKFKKIIAFDERITSICNYIKLKKKLNYKIITRVINNIDIQEKNNKKLIYKFIYMFSKKYFKYSDKYIFQCKEMKNRMVKYFKLENNNKKNIAIYNPLSSQFYNQEINTKKSDYFLMVGRLDEQKGYNYLLETLKICQNKQKEIKVKILGDGIKRKEIEEKINEYQLKNIELLGVKSNVKDYYKNAKGLILTSIYEGFPNVLLEANACGCPVIAFDCPTGPSEIINEETGILIDYLNVNELADKLINYDNLKWDYHKISKLTIEKYNKDVIIKQYLDEVNKI